MNAKAHTLALAVAATLGSIPLPGRADDAATQDASLTSGGLEQVIVTARRRAEKQQEVPLAVTALDESFLTQNSVEKITDLNGKVPALRIESFNSPSYTNIGIRAQRSANVAPGQDSAVGYYFNEVNLGFPVGLSQQMFDLQSVEVVKGPQGTLFGRNTTGGALLLTSQQPTRHFEGSATAGVTSFDAGTGYYGTGVVNVPLGEHFQLRAAVDTIQRDGFVKNLISNELLDNYEVVPFLGTGNKDPMNEEKSTGWRLSALWVPTTSVESLFVYEGSHLHGNGTAYTLTAVNPAGFANFATGGGAETAFLRRQDEQRKNFWTTEQGADLYNKLDTSSIMNRTTWDISDTLRLKNIVAYRDFENQDAIGISGMPYQVLDAIIPDYGHEASEEIQLQGNLAAGAFDWVAGLYYSTQHINHPNETVALPQFGGPPTAQHSVADNDSQAVFAQGTVKLPFLAGLSFTGGARYTSDDREMTAQKFTDQTRTSCALSDENGETLPDDACQLHGKKTFSETTYNVSLDYKFGDSGLVYLAHRRGYRSGGFNYVPDDPQTFAPFDPEIVKDVELGFKKDWQIGSAALRTNLAIYTQDYKGIQRIPSPVDDPTNFSVINAAAATINGGELEVPLKPIEALELSAYYAHIDASFDNFKTGAGDFTDNKMAQVPEDQYSAWVRWTLPLPTTLGQISLQANYAYQTRVYFSDTAQGPAEGPRDSQGQDGYGLLNLRADWQDVYSLPLDVALYVKNATAEEYNTFGIQLYSSLGYNIATIGEPRVYGLEATYRF